MHFKIGIGSQEPFQVEGIDLLGKCCSVLQALDAVGIDSEIVERVLTGDDLMKMTRRSLRANVYHDEFLVVYLRPGHTVPLPLRKPNAQGVRKVDPIAEALTFWKARLRDCGLSRDALKRFEEEWNQRFQNFDVNDWRNQGTAIGVDHGEAYGILLDITKAAGISNSELPWNMETYIYKDGHRVPKELNDRIVAGEKTRGVGHKLVVIPPPTGLVGPPQIIFGHPPGYHTGPPAGYRPTPAAVSDVASVVQKPATSSPFPWGPPTVYGGNQVQFFSVTWPDIGEVMSDKTHPWHYWTKPQQLLGLVFLSRNRLCVAASQILAPVMYLSWFCAHIIQFFGNAICDFINRCLDRLPWILVGLVSFVALIPMLAIGIPTCMAECTFWSLEPVVLFLKRDQTHPERAAKLSALYDRLCRAEDWLRRRFF